MQSVGSDVKGNSLLTYFKKYAQSILGLKNVHSVLDSITPAENVALNLQNASLTRSSVSNTILFA